MLRKSTAAQGCAYCHVEYSHRSSPPPPTALQAVQCLHGIQDGTADTRLLPEKDAIAAEREAGAVHDEHSAADDDGMAPLRS